MVISIKKWTLFGLHIQKKKKRVACLHIHQALSSPIKKKKKKTLSNNRYRIWCDLLYEASFLQACGCEAHILTLTCLW